MATIVVYNGISYSIPSYGDGGYAQGAGNLSLYLVALAGGSLQTTGGTFSLLSDVNFGLNFGLLAKYFTSVNANPASAGTIRLANTDTIDWRNFANSGNDVLAVNGTDQLTYNASPIALVSQITGVRVLQVVSANFIGTETTTSATFQTSSQAVTITPISATSTIMIWAGGEFNVGGATDAEVTILRGATNIGGAQGLCTTSGTARVPYAAMSTDAPGVTTPTIYAVGYRSAVAGQSISLGSGGEQRNIFVAEIG